MKLGASSLIRAKTALNDPGSLSLSKGNFRRFYCSCANYVCIVLFYFFIFKLTKQFYRCHIVCKSQRVRVLTLEGYKTRPLLCHPPRSFSICLTPLKQIKNFVSEKRSHKLCICYLCWRDISIQGKWTVFPDPKPGFNINSGNTLAPKICLTNLVPRALFPGFGVVVWPQKSCLSFTVRLKGGMRLRNSMWHGLRMT